MLTQSFLPLMTSDNRTLGVVPIATTTYTDVITSEVKDTITTYNAAGSLRKTVVNSNSRIGPAASASLGSLTLQAAGGRLITTKPRLVTSYPSDGDVTDVMRAAMATQVIGANTYRLRTVNYHRLSGETWQAGNQMSFVAIDLSPKEERQLYQNNMRGLNLIAFDNKWIMAPNTAFKITYVGQLAAFFAQAAQIQASNPTLTTPTGNNFSRNWAVNSPFSNVGASQFIDINWMEELQVNAAAFAPTVATLGVATSDPGSGLSLRAFLVQQPQPMDSLIVNTTVRIVKIIQGPAAPGTYTWPLTATDSQGNSATFNFSVVVV